MNEDRFRLPDGTHIRYVQLAVQSIEKTLSLYRDLLGFSVVREDGTTVELSASPMHSPQLILTEQRGAAPRSRRAPGLFHTAVLFPDRKELAGAFKKLHRSRYPFQGFADHGVSEALYLVDPEGNGLELYCDRPRERWPSRNGNIEMFTKPLDVEDLLAQAADEEYHIHPDTRIGHIHLQVSDLTKAEQFYHEILGFDVTQRSYPGALFVAAGEYHHHIGLNIWNSRGSSPAPENSLGLLRFGIEVPDKQTLVQLQQRCNALGVSCETFGEGNELQLADFDHIRLTISSKL